MMRTVTAAVVVLLLVPASSVRAQSERDDVHLRNRCRQAAHFLEMGPTHPHYEESLGVIALCDESGPEALVARWHSIDGTDPHDLARLTFETQALRDRTILDALLDLAGEPQRPPAVRLGAMEVLVGYFEPGAAVPSGAFEGRPDPERCGLGSYTHYTARDGAAPIAAADRSAIVQRLAELATDAADETVRAAAACIASAMQLRAGTPGGSMRGESGALHSATIAVF